MNEVQLDVYDFHSEAFREFLETEVWPRYQVNQQPLRHILAGLDRWYRNPCKAVVVERPYVDKEYLDEFAAFYAASFRSYPHTCTRLHFFSCPIPEDGSTGYDEYADDYLGFCVLRPTDLLLLGRTVLAYPDTDPETAFVLARDDALRPHLLTSEMSVCGTPFMQQETQVGVCATAATWMAVRCMSHRYGYREYRPSEITRFAQEHFPSGRVFPAKSGLWWWQMLDALRTMGIEAEFVAKEMIEPSEFVEEVAASSWSPAALSHWSLAAAVYRHVESELPAILLTDDHAFVATGHTYRPKPDARLAVQHLPSLFVNDDARGPYTRLPLTVRHANCCHRDPLSPLSAKLRAQVLQRTFWGVTGAILLSPRECTLSGQDAEDDALQLLSELLRAFPDDMRNALEAELGDLDLSPSTPLLSQFYCRTYLRRQLAVKRWYEEASIGPSLSERIVRMCMPKYLWVSELSTYGRIAGASRGQGQRFGEIVMDATAPAGSGAAMILRLGRLYMLFNRDAPDECEPHWLAPDAPVELPQYSRAPTDAV